VPAPLARGPVKVVIADHALPTIDDLVSWFEAAHSNGRAVAVHCVTRVALVLALAAWDIVGAVDGDRVEHAAIVPLELVDEIARLGLIVVTQPNFIAERGDTYREEVDAMDQPHLYRCGTLLKAGIRVAAGTDAPFGALDPWAAMRSAVARATASGYVLGPLDRITAARALHLFLTPLERPGHAPATIREGAVADLCLLAVPLAPALRALDAAYVRATVRTGRLIGGQLLR
jgi:predicted amidohydrolase YtcJ